MNDDAYEKHKRRAAEAQAEKSRKGREVGDIPAPADLKRRESCRRNLKLFCETYLSKIFCLDWSGDHLKGLRKTQNAILEGGLFALAMPRGSGKSTLFIAAILWAIIYAHHKFALLIGANQRASLALMKNLKKICRDADYALLHSDFPEIFVPLQKLEGIANRAQGQTHQGKATEVVWGKETIVLATIEGCEASGGIIQTGAVKSAVRGANVGGRRPTLCLLDDPQTKTSAKSETQTDEREEIVSADVLGLPGPGDSITALMACTVIEPGDPGDLAARFLDRKRHPDWQGERFQLLYKFPERMDLWAEYRELGIDALNRDASPAEVQRILNEFYLANQTAMELGAEVAWPARRPGRLTGLQYAMDLFYRDEPAFWAEYQNQPQERSSGAEEEALTADEIARKVNQLARAAVPLKAQHLTAFVDVHKDLLYWKVCWWATDFTGGIADYGTWPDQKKLKFKLRDASPTIRKATGLRAILPALRKALDILATDLLSRSYKRPDGLTLKIERLGEDAQWGDGRDKVYEHASEHPQSSLIRPCHGRGITAAQAPMSEWKVPPEEKIGFHWVRKVSREGIRYLLVDTNFWKSHAADAMSLSFEERHSISIFNAKPHEHRLLAEHLSSEQRKKDAAKGREVDLWTIKKGVEDNHWFDTLVGNCVIASELGVVQRTVAKVKKKPLTAAEIRERRARGRAA